MSDQVTTLKYLHALALRPPAPRPQRVQQLRPAKEANADKLNLLEVHLPMLEGRPR